MSIVACKKCGNKADTSHWEGEGTEYVQDHVGLCIDCFEEQFNAERAHAPGTNPPDKEKDQSE